MDLSDPFGKQADPFANASLFGAAQAIQSVVLKGKIHIRYHKQGPRALTLIQGLDDDLDQVRISKAMKKAFSCSTSVQKDKDGKEIIQLQGDHRLSVRSWLLEQEILTTKEAQERLVMHGT